jgi:predicted ATP-dependent endonuclease of OLD family
MEGIKMRIVKMVIDNFRGIKHGTIYFDEHTVLIGMNNSGKSTVIDAIAMVLGRERLVRSMTEHDFYGSNPSPETRINIIIRAC